jgi:flagellar basal body-associated protein FliL
MGKALVMISLASLVAILIMAAMVITSFNHRKDVVLQQDILETKTAESRDSAVSPPGVESVDLAPGVGVHH